MYFSFEVMSSDAKYHRSTSNEEKKIFFSFTISPEDTVSKTTIIYSGRMTTYISGQSKRALWSKNINKTQILLN